MVHGSARILRDGFRHAISGASETRPAGVGRCVKLACCHLWLKQTNELIPAAVEPLVFKHLGRHRFQVAGEEGRCLRVLPNLFEGDMKDPYSKQDQTRAQGPEGLPFNTQERIAAGSLDQRNPLLRVLVQLV